MSEWISVKDRLPERRDNYEIDSYLCNTCYGISTCEFDKGEWGVYDDENEWNPFSDQLDVTHWQPLPEPPK